MKVSEEQFDLIHKYLSSGLDAREQTAFDKNLESLDFREELLSQARLIDSLTDVDASLVRDDLRDINISPIKEEISTTAAQPTRRPQSSRRWFWLVGALVLMMTALWFMFNPGKVDTSSPMLQMAQAYDTPLPPGHQQRGGSEQAEASAAMLAYANESYEEAINLFLSKDNPTTSDKLYIANCYIQLGRYEEARSTLNSIELLVTGKVKDDADWYLAIASLGLEDRNGAERLLKNIAKDTDNIYQTNAQKLLNELK